MIERSRVRIPAGAAGEFSSPWSTFCADLFRYPFHPRVTAVARKDPGHSAKSAGGRLQVNTHAPYVCGFASTDMVHGCGIHRTRRDGSSFTWHQPCQRCKYTT